MTAGPTDRQILHVLLVEDNPGDARLVQDALAVARMSEYHVASVARLDTAIEHVAQQHFDITLLDLHLPDSAGLATVSTFYEHVPDLPLIVLTGDDDAALELQLAAAGADDFIGKDTLNPRLLERAIRYALERRRLLIQVEATKQSNDRDREIQSLTRLSGGAASSVTAQMFGLAPLRETAPNIFNELVQQYESLAELALEQRAYRVEHNLTERLRFMAERIGFLNAGPRDVIEIHTNALQRKLLDAPAARANAYIEEGRLMVLELMGYLVSFYRNYSLGARRFPMRTQPPGEAGPR